MKEHIQKSTTGSLKNCASNPSRVLLNSQKIGLVVRISVKDIVCLNISYVIAWMFLKHNSLDYSLQQTLAKPVILF